MVLLHSLSIIDSKIVVCTSSCVNVWKIVHEAKFEGFRGHEGPILQMCFAKDNNLFSTSVDNTIREWYMNDMSCMSLKKSCVSEISSICSFFDPNYIFTGHEDGSIVMWILEVDESFIIKQHTNTISGMIVFTQGSTSRLISASYDCKIGVWNISKRKTSKIYFVRFIESYPTSEFFCINFNPLAQTIIAGCSDGSIRMYFFV